MHVVFAVALIAVASEPPKPTSILSAIRKADKILLRSPNSDPDALSETIDEAGIFDGKFSCLLNVETVERVRRAGPAPQPIQYVVSGYVNAYHRPAGRYKSKAEIAKLVAAQKVVADLSVLLGQEKRKGKRVRSARGPEGNLLRAQEKLRSLSKQQAEILKSRKVAIERIEVAIVVPVHAEWFDSAKTAKKKKERFVGSIDEFRVEQESFGPLKQRIGSLRVKATAGG